MSNSLFGFPAHHACSKGDTIQELGHGEKNVDVSSIFASTLYIFYD